MNEKRRFYLKQIPAVNDLLTIDISSELITLYSHQLVVEGIRKVTERLRNKILKINLEKIDDINIDSDQILKQVEKYLQNKTSLNLTPAINATGVVIHTNLGRSLLCRSAQKAVQDISANYSTLEIDRDSGERGSRYNHVEGILCELTGAEAGMVVNNNAAAVLLTLSSLAAGKEAIISRGQLVEIGGSFRIPEVMEQSGAKLVEVGATNRVHLADYKRAINEETGLLLKVHTSNYKVMGFTKEVELEELVTLGNEHNLPVVDDLGSGILVDLTSSGLSYEPTVQESIKAGADIVTFSGDKLLGGPQAGIIVGNKKYIDMMKNHPLNRALRVDKFTLTALEATLQEYRNLEKAIKEIPTLNMITTSEVKLKEQAEMLAKSLKDNISSEFKVSVRQDNSRVGGGAFPLEELSTYVIKISHNKLKANEIGEKIRFNNPPIFTRIYDNDLIFDLRTIKKEDFPTIVEALKGIS